MHTVAPVLPVLWQATRHLLLCQPDPSHSDLLGLYHQVSTNVAAEQKSAANLENM